MALAKYTRETLREADGLNHAKSVDREPSGIGWRERRKDRARIRWSGLVLFQGWKSQVCWYKSRRDIR